MPPSYSCAYAKFISSYIYMYREKVIITNFKTMSIGRNKSVEDCLLIHVGILIFDKYKYHNSFFMKLFRIKHK